MPNVELEPAKIVACGYELFSTTIRRRIHLRRNQWNRLSRDIGRQFLRQWNGRSFHSIISLKHYQIKFRLKEFGCSIQYCRSHKRKLVNAHFIELLRCDLFLLTIPTLKHKIFIATDHTGNSIDDSIFHCFTRRIISAADRFVKEIDRFIARVVVKFDSNVVTGLPLQCS